MGDRIYQQIEQTADYYDPGTYFDHLTQNHSIEISPDSLTNDFIPLSTVPATADAKMKLFVIGLIPPSAQVTGRLLDRSKSVAALAGGGGQVLDLPADSRGANTGKGDPTVPVGNEGNGVPAVMTKLSYQQAAAAIRAGYKKQTGHYPTDNELAMYVAHSIRETSLNWPNFNPGFVGNAAVNKPRPGGHERFYWPPTKTTFYSYPTAEAGAEGFLRFIPGPARKAAESGDPKAYSQALADVKYFGDDSVEVYAKGFANIDVLKRQIGPQSGLDNIALPNPITQSPTDGGSTASFQQSGSSNAQRQISQGSKTDLNSSALGRKFAEAQAMMAIAVQNQIELMASTPPLRMLVNPQSFRVGNEKVVQDSSRSRNGPIIEIWGDGQDTIEASGKIGAFYCADIAGAVGPNLTESGGPGLTRTARVFSASYQNFLSLYQIYRNNAGINVGDTVDSAAGQKTNLVLSGSIYIYFDHTLYIGSFDSFTITETDTAPYTLEYSFQFTVRATFLLDQVADPKLTYGTTNLNPTAASPNTIQIPREAPPPRADQQVPNAPTSLPPRPGRSPGII